jgi:hypothetical protein
VVDASLDHAASMLVHAQSFELVEDLVIDPRDLGTLSLRDQLLNDVVAVVAHHQHADVTAQLSYE